MEKFSSGKQPKNNKQKETKKQEGTSDEAMYVKIYNLMDTFLRVKSMGSVDNRYLNGSVIIDGKADFIHAVLDVLKEEKIKESKAILENLKSSNSDWLSIDNYINHVLSKHDTGYIRENIEDYMRRYDEDTFIRIMENKIQNMDVDIKNKYIHVVNNMDCMNPETKKSLIDKLNK